MIPYILLILPIIVLIVIIIRQSKSLMKYKGIASEKEEITYQRIQEQNKDEINQHQKKIEELKIQEKHEIDSLENIVNRVRDAQASASKSVEDYYNQCLATVEEQIKLKHEKLTQNYQKTMEILNQEYEQNKNSKQQELDQFTQQCNDQIQLVQSQLDRLQKKVNSATEVAKRAEAEQNEKEFYRIHLSNEDIEEIKRIRSIEPYLRNKEPLNKIIWKYYYEKPVNEMIGRVIGPGTHIGIYKITEINSGKCYVGQSVDLSSRFKQHIKRGIGAETPTKNKLYPAMLAIGPENFTFEVIQECQKEELDSLEDEYQAFFHSIDFGYSIK